jgi:CubicO group peptidase (beta-lactamase class C family)
MAVAARTALRGTRADRLSDQELVQRLQWYIPLVLKVTGTPGLSVAVARQGDLVMEESFGYADLQQKREMTAGTGMRVSSITKWYTAAAVLQLVERGHVDLWRSVNSYFTDISVVNPLGLRDVTPYDLLTHRSGLATDAAAARGSFPGRRSPHLEDHLASVLERNKRREYHGGGPCWTAPVGEAFQYSNLGVALLGYLVEQANPDRLTYGQYLREQILRPLGMSSSAVPAVESCPQVEREHSTGYARFADVRIPTPLIETSTYPADGLVTTAADHIKFVLSQLNNGQLDGHRVLLPETVRLMTSAHTSQAGPATEPGTHYGLGVEIFDIGRSVSYFGHAGAYPFGWWGDSRIYPHHRLAVVVLTNKWDLFRWYNPLKSIAPGLVADYTARLVAEGSAAHDDRRNRPWGWKTAYVMGMVLAERMAGLLAGEEPLTEARLRDIAEHVSTADGATGIEWDTEGFVAGALDMLPETGSPERIRSFVRSDGIRVEPEEHELLWLALGRHGPLPLPMPFWATA